MPKRKAPEAPSKDLSRHFEGVEALQTLLVNAGCLWDVGVVVDGFRAAQKDGLEAAQVFPELFEEEPRFESPASAQALYQNLFGLWDMVADNPRLDFANLPERKRAPKPPKAKAPGPFEGEVPTPAEVEAQWGFLEACTPKERERLRHAFDNRQDGVVVWLDQQGLSDEAYGLAHPLAFELFAILSLGFKAPLSRARPDDVTAAQEKAVPEALKAHLEEALAEAEDEADPLSQAELAKVRAAVTTVAACLWRARPDRA